jgi:hypothetical protein
VTQFNPNDPRYQRELQTAAARRSMGPSKLERVTTGEIAGRHAGYQLGREQQFRRLALYGDLTGQRHEQALARADQATETFGLAQRQQGFKEKEFKRDLKREKSGLNQTMLMGLLGTGLSTLEANRREKILTSQIANQRYRTGLMEDYMWRAKIGYDPTEEEQ